MQHLKNLEGLRKVRDYSYKHTMQAPFIHLFLCVPLVEEVIDGLI